MKKVYLKDVKPYVDCEISGFVEKIREQKTMQFLVLKDSTSSIQVAIEKEKMPEISSVVSTLTRQSVVRFVGRAIPQEKVTLRGMEFVPISIEVDSRAEDLPIDEASSKELKLDYRWIDLRQDKERLIFQIRTFVEMTMKEFITKEEFIEIHSSKISAQSSEGGAEVFAVDYYGQKAYLTQSPQFYKQMAIASGFDKVFEIGPIYRAEKSFTARHASEATCLDVEIGHIKTHHDVMDFEEKLLIYILTKIEEKFGEKIKEVFKEEVLVPVSIPRIKLSEVFKIFKDVYEIDVPKSKQLDLDPEQEKLICEYSKQYLGSEAVFITDYPSEARAFYSKKIDGSFDSLTFDLLYKGWEMSSGAVREHRYEELKTQIEEHGIKSEYLKDYLEFFRFGCPRHGGFGFGIDRFITKLLGLPSIKESIFIFRGPSRIRP